MMENKDGIQSTLVISKSRGLSGILRDIRTSTFQICGIEESSCGHGTKAVIQNHKSINE